MKIQNGSAVVFALLAGCGDMSGLGGTSQFACKAPVGVHCESLSGTYYNSLANNLPAQRRHAPAGKEAAKMNAPAQTTRPTTVPDTAGFAPLALRVPSREMRIWIKAWQDEDKDLVDQSYVYLVVTEGQWRVAHVQQQERNAFARLSPPQPTGRPDSAPSAQPGQPVPASSASPAPRAEPEDPSGK